MDVATLGLAVDSSQVTKGAKSLDVLSNSAKRAEAAASGVSSSTRNAGSAAVTLAASSGRAAAELNTEAAAAQKAAAAMRLHSIAANSNIRGLKNFNTANLAAQFQDVAVSAQMGMGALQIGLQQGTQLAAVIAAMENPIKGLGTAFASVISPVSLLVIGLTAAAAAGLQMVNWAALASSALNGLADALSTIAPYAVGAAAALALIYAPAILGGLALLSEAILGVTARLAGLAIGFALANPATAFVLGITAAIAAANIFRDELTQIFGVDIVGVAKSAVNWMIGAFVGGYRAIVATWDALPSALGDLGYQAADRFYAAFTSMLRDLRSDINSFIEGINSKLGSSIPTIGGGLVGLNPNGTQKHVANPYAGAASGVANAASDAFGSAMNTDYVGAGLDIIAKGASAASGKLKELAGWMTTVDEKKKKKGGKTDAEKYDDIIDGANRRIASLQAEYDALGMTEMAAAKLAYETEMLNQAQQKGITLSAAQKAEISSLADRMAALEIATKNAREAMDFAKDLTKGFIGDLRSGLEQGKSFWESFGNAALNVLDKITDKLLDDVLTAIFKVNSAGTGGGGFWGSLLSAFGLGGGGSGFAGAASVVASGGFSGLYANGTASARAGYAIVGEKGPEIVKFGGGEQVIPNHRIVAANDRAANQNGDMNVTYAPVYNVNGSGPEITQLRQEMARDRAQFKGRVVEAVADARRRHINI